MKRLWLLKMKVQPLYQNIAKDMVMLVLKA